MLRNMGVLYDIRIMVDTIVAIWNIQSRVNMGILVSSLSMSVEKRFRILPIGVVSKKDMGARSMLSRRRPCITRAAVIPPIMTDSEMPKVDNTGKR